MVPKIRLGELLIREGRLSDDQLQQALARQKQTGRRLGAVLQDLGFVTDDVIARLLAAQLKFPYFEPQLEMVDVAVAKRLSELQVRKLRALPVGLAGSHVRVAVVDPTDWQSMDDLPRLLRGSIDFEVIPESGLHALIDRIYSSNENIQGLAKKLSEELRSNEGDAVDFQALGLQAGAEDAPVVKLLQGLFDEAVRTRASDIHIEPHAQAVAIRLRVETPSWPPCWHSNSARWRPRRLARRPPPAGPTRSARPPAAAARVAPTRASSRSRRWWTARPPANRSRPARRT